MKRNGVLLTCFVSRAVDIETTKSMETDSFILTLRRFIARRGNVRTIRSDNGSNFVGAERELEKSMEETNHSKIQRFMLNRNADWIVRKRNPPLASHMGGVWERQSRFARSILSSFLRSNRKSLDEESLNTLLTEVEAIINSRPLIVEIINDANSEVEISSSHLLPSVSCFFIKSWFFFVECILSFSLLIAASMMASLFFTAAGVEGCTFTLCHPL